MADLLCLAIKTMRSGAPAVRDRLRDVVVCTHQGSMYGSQPLTRAVECYILHRYEGSATRSRQLRVVSARPGHARLLTLSNCARIPPKPLCIGVAALDRGCGTICQPTYLHTYMYVHVILQIHRGPHDWHQGILSTVHGNIDTPHRLLLLSTPFLAPPSINGLIS